MKVFSVQAYVTIDFPWDCRMNPLGLRVERFVVAEGSGGEIQGFGQLAPLGGAAPSGKQPLELKSLIVEPAHRCTKLQHIINTSRAWLSHVLKATRIVYVAWYC